ncbi:MAG: methylated-DNA--[protein]-cysteine S-methyltransferase [Corynebacterium sp.]|nr:methylated-DNA--[protein]-cysteine S-methyltransferase [Corynebacterium sp.]
MASTASSPVTTASATTEVGWNPLHVNCPSHKLLRTVTGRWAILIVSALAERPLRFGELREAIGGISDKMLAQCLRDLKDASIIDHDGTQYSLTPLGRSFLVPLGSLINWVTSHMDSVYEQQSVTGYWQGPNFTVQIDASTAGLTKVSFLKSHGGVATTYDLPESPAGHHVANAIRELDAYLADPAHQPQAVLDWDAVAKDRDSESFRFKVWHVLADTQPGETLSYGQVAAAAGSPKAVRAVGSACAQNPWPLFIGCHRVIKSDGTPGEYAGSAEVKAFLLAHEEHAK